jgi:hypothetical protein
MRLARDVGTGAAGVVVVVVVIVVLLVLLVPLFGLSSSSCFPINSFPFGFCNVLK